MCILQQMNILLMPARSTDKNPQLFERDYPFANNDKPFGEVRVIVDSSFLARAIQPASAR